MLKWSLFTKQIGSHNENVKVEIDTKSSFGRFQFRFLNDQGNPVDDPLWLVWKDFNEHLLITGGSGSGKTSTVLHQLYEGLVFGSSQHSDLSIKNRFCVGGLVIEAKGDFVEKTEILSKRYQREESIVYFGPRHLGAIYNPFGDPQERPLQKANKMYEIIKAASGGKEGGDPFWSQASQKLMTNLFILHDRVLQSGAKVPSLSFKYLNLLCLDKESLTQNNSDLTEYSQALRNSFNLLRRTFTKIQEERERIEELSDRESSFLNDLIEIKDQILEMQLECSEGYDNERGRSILEQIEASRNSWDELLSVLPWDQSRGLREQKSLLLSQGEESQIQWRGLARAFSEIKKKGPLGDLLDQYCEILEKEGISFEEDWVYSYFKNEYLNPVNEKTSASIAMVVSNALMPFVTAPLDQMFSSESTFDFQKVIDRGQLVVLDMPSAEYGVVQLLVSLVLKNDFFRTVLNRPRLWNREENRRVNQERHLIYLCDEFGSIATTGDQTGEASFLDKVREYRCSCILAMQGLPSLLRKFSVQEVDALLQNCGIKVFLRNDDPSTNEYASRALGSEIKVRLNQNTGATEHWMDPNKKWGSRAYSTSYERASRFSSDQFVSFRVGEGVLRLPARFGDQMVRKVHFDFNPILS